MLLASTPPSKGINWQTGLKRKTLRFIYKKSISPTETNIGLG
jgi:hypothetical protein